jgi:hypothetical protein
VKNLGENLDGFDDGRARSIEERVAVRKGDAAVSDGRQFGPAWQLLQDIEILERAIESEAARRDDEVIRICVGDLFPGHRHRVVSGFGKQRRAARGVDELRSPVPRREERIRPLQQYHRWARAILH